MKHFNFRNIQRKYLMIATSILVVAILTLSVAYAALSVTLNIQGNAQVNATGWDIHLENIKVKNGSISNGNASIISPTTANFSVSLDKPGDFYEFTVDVVNDGGIDAMIESVSKTPTLTTEQAKYLNYVIEYENGTAITEKQLVKAKESVRLKVRLAYRTDLNSIDLPTSLDTLNLSFTVNYEQSNGEGTSEVPDNGETVKVVNVEIGDGLTPGNIISIGDEQFRVVKVDGDDIIMLAEYNLQVGQNYDWESEEYSQISNPTGIQDVKSKGYTGSSNMNNSVVAFSSTNYWSSTTSTYPARVYNSSSNLYQYVENYKTYLTGLGAEIKEARLIYIDELEGLGCSMSNYSCSSAESWVYQTTYWSGSAYDSSFVWFVDSYGNFVGNSYYYAHAFGVRPVIVIDKSLI